ncbi:type I polyketide synthase [Nocardia brasiliensis]|uniref:type I polyketide synthase n=1 Tax=Nocardia brasiliensis TaxID=37326 RepID=UPI002453F946|nr:type I polyketide synthase [Nocardia brasiliensis]
MSGQPIAIVGMGCRLPGGVASPEEFWDALVEGRDLITEVGRDRWNVDEIYDPEPGKAGKTVSRWGGLLDDIAGFDAEFFDISPREAAWIDPQQRQILEVGYEALEDAGIPLEQIRGSDCGVYLGQSSGDYWTLVEGDSRRFGYYAMTGAWGRSMTSGRLSFAFDLRGPTLTIDTACSSGLAAVDAAVRYLRTGGKMALAAAVNLTLVPDASISYSAGRMLSATGRCKFADADADGFVRAEAVTAVVLKPLDAALADGDRIRAVLRGSANGSDGRNGGSLTRPGPEAQRHVIVKACRDAGIEPADVDFVEAHGTGTPAGDPVELETLGAAFGQGRPQHRPVLVTASKTNLGHAEAAAGLIGLIKAVLCLEHRTIPASLHLTHPNPAIAWDRLPVQIIRTATALPTEDRPLIAGINSFGISGNNTHVVLSSAPPTRSTPVVNRTQILVLSAACPEALRDTASNWARYLETSSAPFADICHSAALRRTRHAFRFATVADTGAAAALDLREFADSTHSAVSCGAVDRPPRVVFVFPGQGSQWAAMGRGLLRDEPVYSAAFDECAHAIITEIGTSVRELIEQGSEDWLSRTEVVQPALWATQVALAALWRSWGVEPEVVVGHSMGEVAAACVSGALSVADAAAVICRRSALAAQLDGRGAMIWTELPGQEADKLVSAIGGAVTVAAYNSPRSTLLSGDASAVTALATRLENQGVTARLIKVAYASHCQQIDEIREPLLQALADIAPRPTAISFQSTLLARRAEGTELDAEYWAHNIREPVRFTSAIGALADDDTVFVEVSVHPILLSAIRESQRQITAFGSLCRHLPERPALLETVAKLYVQGVPIDFSAIAPGHYVPLPRYTWQHERYWLPDADHDAAATEKPISPVEAETTAGPRHPLLGETATLSDGGRCWLGPIDLTVNDYLLDHQVQTLAIFPGTGYAEMLAAAAQQVLGTTSLAIKDMCCLRALFLDAAQPQEVRLTAHPEQGRWRMEIHSCGPAEDEWTLHVTATAEVAQSDGLGTEEPTSLARQRCPHQQTGEEFYDHHAARGNQWRGAFHAIEQVWSGSGEAVARVLRREVDHRDGGELFHPALLDSCAQAILAARPEVPEGADSAFVLGGIGEYRFYRRPRGPLWSHAVLLPDPAADCSAGSVRIRDADGVVAELDNVWVKYLMGHKPTMSTDKAREAALKPMDTDDWLYLTRWQRAVKPDSAVPVGRRWLVLQDSGPVGRGLIEQLRGRGDVVTAVTVAAAFDCADRQLFQAAPGSNDDLDRVVALASAEAPLDGVVHLWSLDAPGSPDPTDCELERAAELGCISVAHLVRALDEAPCVSRPRLWLVTRGAQAAVPADTVRNPCQAMLWGLGPAVAAEHPSLQTTLVDLDERDYTCNALTTEILAADTENRVALREGMRMVVRLCRKPAEYPASRLGHEHGVLDNIRFLPTSPPLPGPGQVVIDAEHAALNFRDVLCATGAYPGQDGAPLLGWECAGKVAAVGTGVTDLVVGDRVAAIVEGALATHVLAAAQLTVRLPVGLDCARAATMPFAFATAYQALVRLGQVESGERVLIHTVSGGVGLAAVQVARWRGAQVYGTCGSDKQDALAELGLDGVADSRSMNFVEQFRTATDGHGFDVIVNTLVGDAVTANLSLLAPGGRYIELAKRDILDGSVIRMDALTKNRSFHAMDMVELVRRSPQQLGPTLRAVFALYERGEFTPLRARWFRDDQVVDAFRQMARAQHIGKLVIALPASGRTAPPPATVAATDSQTAGTHLLTGGFGGLGRSVARHLVETGVRDLVLIGRSELSDDPEDAGPRLLRDLRSLGVCVEYQAVDVADRTELRRLIMTRRIAGAPPIRAVYHLAGVLEQGTVAELDARRLTAILRPKVAGSLSLHHAIADEPIQRFVLFSSASAVLDSPTLGGYAAGNAYLVALSHYRWSRDLPATVVNWGYWDSIGMIAQARKSGHDPVPCGMDTLAPDRALSLLDSLAALDGHQATTALRVDWQRWARTYPTAARSPLLRELITYPQERASAEPGEAVAATTTPSPPVHDLDGVSTSHRDQAHLAAEAVAALTRNRAAEAVAPPRTRQDANGAPEVGCEDSLVDHIARILGLRPERVRRDRLLTHLGVDSLMATELRNLIEQEFSVVIQVAEILKGHTARSLAALVDRNRELAVKQVDGRTS